MTSDILLDRVVYRGKRDVKMEALIDLMGLRRLPQKRRPRMLEVVEMQTAALLWLEWSGWDDAAGKHCCPRCSFLALGGNHEERCTLDAGLVVVGLDTPEKRDAERRRLRI